MAAIYRNVPHSTLAYTVYPKAETFVFALQTGRGGEWLDATVRGFRGTLSPAERRNSSSSRFGTQPPDRGNGGSGKGSGNGSRDSQAPGKSFTKSHRSFSTRFWAGYITLFGTTMITHPLDVRHSLTDTHPNNKQTNLGLSFGPLLALFHIACLAALPTCLARLSVRLATH